VQADPALRRHGAHHVDPLAEHQIILEFGLHKPAFRIVVNSPTTHGSVGLSTGLDPAMTLGCGGYGGNITSDNISPRHLLNIKRVAYELRPTVSRWDRAAGNVPGLRTDAPPNGQTLPAAPVRRAPPSGISAETLSRRIDDFLGSRGFKPESTGSGPRANQMGIGSVPGANQMGTGSVPGANRVGTGSVPGANRVGTGSVPGAQQTFTGPGSGPAANSKPLDFVCEEDVRLAIQAGRKLVVSERAIVTPAARDLAEANRVFTVAPWQG